MKDLDSSGFLKNELMGVVKVLSIDKNRIEHGKGVCSMINEQIFNI